MITGIIIILTAAVFLILSGHIYLNFRKISKKGNKAEGIIFDIEGDESITMTPNYPIVRFLTDKNEWITESYKIGLIPGCIRKVRRLN